MARFWPWLLVVAGVACQETGGVNVRIALPESDQLLPLDTKLTRLTLIVEQPGAPLSSATREIVDGAMDPLEFGELAVGAGQKISLMAISASGRMVGFGRASTPIDVATGQHVEVPVRLRRPFTYLAGGSRVYALDSTTEPGQSYASLVGMAARSRAVATTADGAEVVAAGDSTVYLLSTGTHMPVGSSQAAIMPGAAAVAVTPDSRQALVLHKGTGVSVVDLVRLRGGQSAGAATFVPIAGATTVAAGGGIAYVLVDGGDDCGKPSKVVPVFLEAPIDVDTAIPVGTTARDLAVIGTGVYAGQLAVAEPCQNTVAVVRVDGSNNSPKLFMIPAPTSVAVSADRVWAVGHASGPSGAFVVVGSSALDGGSATRIDLPPSQELAKSNDLTMTGQTTEVRLAADGIDAADFAVLPDGQHGAILVHGRYHADETVRTVVILGTPTQQVLLPEMDMETWEYQLVDLSTGSASQRLRTSCSIMWDEGVAFVDDWSCTSAAGQDTTAEDFAALGVAVLYGAR